MEEQEEDDCASSGPNQYHKGYLETSWGSTHPSRVARVEGAQCSRTRMTLGYITDDVSKCAS